jgi:tRNA pseudouridine55 synthase
VLGLADAVRRCFPFLTVDDATAAAVRHGRRLTEVALPAPRVALFTDTGEFLALYRQQLSEAVPEAVFV